MADIVIMPKLGQATEESTIVKWHKREGDAVKKGEILFEMETDKAVLEAESFFEGTLLKVLVKEGETVPVNVAVAFIGTPGEKLPDVPPPPAVKKAETGSQRPEAGGQRSEVRSQRSEIREQRSESRGQGPETGERRPVRPAPAAPAAPARLLISPRARALAKACLIDPAPIAGSGPDGRITEADVKAYLAAHRYDAIRISPAARARAAQEKMDILKVKGTGPAGRIVVADVERALKERPRPMSKMRQVIARRLTDSFTTTPHFYVTTSVDMTDLLAFRKERKDRGEAWGVTDFILEAVILSLQEFAPLNSVTDGHTIRWRANVDLGMAVGLDDGLVVPVIRAAQDLSMTELHDRIETLGKKAREGKLLPDEMTGSSFTVSNMGMFNVENFGAIINPGESGILAVSSTIPQAAARNGQIVVRQMMKITASVDHRIVDGTTGALFVNAVKAKLEDMELWKRLMS